MATADEVRLAATAARQHGVFTRPQAIAAGFGAGQIERRVRSGIWRRLLPRVYVHAAAPASVAQTHWAAVSWCGPGCALSHSSAAAIWRIGSLPLAAPELVVARTRAPRAEGIVVHRSTSLLDRDVTCVAGLPVTTPLRSIIDLAGVLSPDDLERTVTDARIRGLVTVRAVLVRLEEHGSAGRPGAALLRTLLPPIGSVWVDRSARMAG
jgi:hypothetical protein